MTMKKTTYRLVATTALMAGLLGAGCGADTSDYDIGAQRESVGEAEQAVASLWPASANGTVYCDPVHGMWMWSNEMLHSCVLEYSQTLKACDGAYHTFKGGTWAVFHHDNTTGLYQGTLNSGASFWCP